MGGIEPVYGWCPTVKVYGRWWRTLRRGCLPSVGLGAPHLQSYDPGVDSGPILDEPWTADLDPAAVPFKTRSETVLRRDRPGTRTWSPLRRSPAAM